MAAATLSPIKFIVKIAAKNTVEMEKQLITHQMLAASLVSPELKAVIPLCPEPIYQKRWKEEK